MSERPWGKGHVVGSDQFFTGRSTSSDSSEALRKAAERSVQQSKEESMTTEHSPEAVAAYPSIMGEEEITEAQRAAFDRGMAERRVVERDALVWQVRAAIEPFLETFVYLDLNIQADNEQMDDFATAIVDAILAPPSTSLIGAREAVEKFLDGHEHIQFEGHDVVIVYPDETARELFASGAISERREAEAGDEAWVIEVDWAEDEARNTLPALIGPFPSRKAAQDCGEDIIFNGDWGVAQVSDAAQLRNGGDGQ